jgi:hypothetical protein
MQARRVYILVGRFQIGSKKPGRAGWLRETINPTTEKRQINPQIQNPLNQFYLTQ